MPATVKMHNGVEIPLLGLGTWKMSDSEARQAVGLALKLGYRHIDTASVYGNEVGVGRAIAESNLPRESVFVTTKLWNDAQRAGYDACLQAFDESLARLGLSYVDLYLVHWPCKGRYLEAWRAMESIYASGRARAVGVSNFMVHHLDDLLRGTSLVPHNNQVELHPRLVQRPLMTYCRERRIVQTAWSPLMKGAVAAIPELVEIGRKYGKTPAQVALRWNVQLGVVTIPKTTRRERLEENAAIFDFELSSDDMARITSLDRGERIGPDPDNFAF